MIVPMRESSRALAAFEAYWGLGDRRTYIGVARALGSTRKCIERYAHDHDWEERVKQRILADAAAQEAVKRDTLDAFEAHMLASGKALYDDALSLVQRQIKRGRVSAASVMALQEARAIALRGLRQPASITRTEQTGVGGGPVEQEVVIRQYVGIDIAIASGTRATADDPSLPSLGSGSGTLSRPRP